MELLIKTNRLIWSPLHLIQAKLSKFSWNFSLSLTNVNIIWSIEKLKVNEIAFFLNIGKLIGSRKALLLVNCLPNYSAKIFHEFIDETNVYIIKIAKADQIQTIIKKMLNNTNRNVSTHGTWATETEKSFVCNARPYAWPTNNMENAKPKLIQVAFGKSDTQRYTIVCQFFVGSASVCNTVSHISYRATGGAVCVCVCVCLSVCIRVSVSTVFVVLTCYALPRTFWCAYGNVWF